MSFCLCPCLFSPWPPCLCMPTPSHLHPYAPHVQTISVYPGVLYQTNPLFITCSWALRSSFCPHIHLIIIFSVLSRRCMSSNFIGHVSLSYIIALWTHALYSLPFTFSDTPLEVRSGDSSLNLLQAHRTLTHDASSAPPPAPIMSPK
jgi:hypothetical protein